MSTGKLTLKHNRKPDQTIIYGFRNKIGNKMQKDISLKNKIVDERCVNTSPYIHLCKMEVRDVYVE
jgi:hypothetical protein